MERLLFKIYNSKKSTALLNAVSHISVILVLLGYFSVLHFSYADGLVKTVKLLALSAVPFLTVSIFRYLFNAPRPYELYGFYKSLPKHKSGKSFPSRHVFSSFLIATLAFNYSIILGVLLAALSFVLACARVLLGIHFVRDCIAGALIGVISGIIGIMLI